MVSKLLTKYCHQLLEAGRKQLDLPIGVVSQIYHNTYKIIAIDSEIGSIRDGVMFPLRDAYCRDIYRTGQTFATTDIDESENRQRHPLYVKLPLRAYISTPIRHKEQIWGTLNFTSTRPHDPFTAADILLIESYALLLHKKLFSLDTPPRSNHDAPPSPEPLQSR